MKSFKELDAIAEFIISNKLPKEHIIFQNAYQHIQTSMFLKGLGSYGVASGKYKNTSLECDIVVYGAVTFYFVNTGYFDKVEETHNWVESKTFFKENTNDKIDPSDKYILSRYCNCCGKTETYHGSKQKWVETGYITICKKQDE